MERENQQLHNAARVRQIKFREWWLLAFAVAVTLALTLGIVSLTYFGHRVLDDSQWLELREWVRGLACLILLFDTYTLYQQLQLQRTRRELMERKQLFELITENAADMIAVIDGDGRRLYNNPAYENILGYSPEDLQSTSALEQIHPADRQQVSEAAEKAHLTGRGETLEYRVRHKNGTWRIL